MNNVYYFNLQDRMKFIKGFNMKTFGHFFVSVTKFKSTFLKTSSKQKKKKLFVSFFLFTVYHKKVQEYFT